jgi:hypothetical protein
VFLPITSLFDIKVPKFGNQANGSLEILEKLPATGLAGRIAISP